jgi:hypothetical protein
MHKKVSLWLSILIAFIFVSFIWQIAETHIVTFTGKLSYKVFKKSFIEINTHDAQGIPMRYYPGVGLIYDPEYIAQEASRFYKTRVEKDREQSFLQLSGWLEQQLDTKGLLPDNYNFPPANRNAPWYRASTQAAAMVALAQRAGFLRNTDTLRKAENIFVLLQSGNSDLSIESPDSTVWFTGKSEKSISGMINTLLKLNEYYELLGNPKAKELYEAGLNRLQYFLPELEREGYLDDPSVRVGRRLEHQQFIGKLEEINKRSPNPVLSADIDRYKRLDRNLTFFQMIMQGAVARLAGFLLACFAVSLIVYKFLRVPR